MSRRAPSRAKKSGPAVESISQEELDANRIRREELRVGPRARRTKPWEDPLDRITDWDSSDYKAAKRPAFDVWLYGTLADVARVFAFRAMASEPDPGEIAIARALRGIVLAHANNRPEVLEEIGMIAGAYLKASARTGLQVPNAYYREVHPSGAVTISPFPDERFVPAEDIVRTQSNVGQSLALTIRTWVRFARIPQVTAETFATQVVGILIQDLNDQFASSSLRHAMAADIVSRRAAGEAYAIREFHNFEPKGRKDFSWTHKDEVMTRAFLRGVLVELGLNRATAKAMFDSERKRQTRSRRAKPTR